MIAMEMIMIRMICRFDLPLLGGYVGSQSRESRIRVTKHSWVLLGAWSKRLGLRDVAL